MQYTSQIEKLQRLWLANPHGTTFAPLAEAYRKAGMFEDALGALEIGLSRHPKYFPGHIVLGRCYTDLKDEVKAEDAFLKVLELDAENVIALKALADHAETHGQRDVAVERLQRLLDLDPANEDALAQLARVATEPVVVVAPVLEPDAEAEPPADEALGGQGEVIDPAGVDFEVQLFQPIELLPLDVSEFQVPNDAESLRARESGAFAWTEPAVPAPEEPVSSSIPAEPPAEPVATLDDIRWASDGLDFRPRAEVAEPELEAPVAEVAAPSGDDYPAEIVLEAAIPPAHVPSIEPDSVTVVVVDLPPRRLTLEPTLLQLPVIPPLPPMRVAAVREDLTVAAGGPARDQPELAEAAAAPAEPEPAAPTALDSTPAAASPEWEPPAEPARADVPVQAWSADLDPPALAEHLTAADEPVSAADEPVPSPAFTEPSGLVGEEPAAAAEEPAVPAWSGGLAEVEHLTAEAASPSDVPTMAGILAGSAPAEPAVEEDAPADSEPELVVTETMAEIFQRQGYTELALAVYSQLATRDPGNPRIEAAKSRLMTERIPPATTSPVPEPPVRRFAVAATGGRPATAWLAQVFAVGPPGAVQPVHPPAFEAAPAAEPTRASTDTLSLSSVFGGDETVLPAPADSSHPVADTSHSGEESGPSFDEFFGTPAERAPIAGDAPSGSGQPIEDLEQFNAWLKGLKR